MIDELVGLVLQDAIRFDKEETFLIITITFFENKIEKKQ